MRSLPYNGVLLLDMGKILVLLLMITAAVAFAKRVVRSPTPGLGWQIGSSYSYGSGSLPFLKIARSPSSNWGRAGRVRSSRNGGWSSNKVGPQSRKNGYEYKRSPNNGWSGNGYGSNSDYGGTFVRSYYPELRGRSSDSTVIDSIDSLAWDGSGFYSNNGWESMRW